MAALKRAVAFPNMEVAPEPEPEPEPTPAEMRAAETSPRGRALGRGRSSLRDVTVGISSAAQPLLAMVGGSSLGKSYRPPVQDEHTTVREPVT